MVLQTGPTFAEKESPETDHSDGVNVVFGGWTSASPFKRRAALYCCEARKTHALYPIQYEVQESVRKIFFLHRSRSEQQAELRVQW